MLDADYLFRRAHEELDAAMRSPDPRVRNRHLELADAYAFKLSEVRRQERESKRPFLLAS